MSTLYLLSLVTDLACPCRRMVGGWGEEKDANYTRPVFCDNKLFSLGFAKDPWSGKKELYWYRSQLELSGM